MAYKTILVYAPLRAPVNPDNPARPMALFDRHLGHPADERYNFRKGEVRIRQGDGMAGLTRSDGTVVEPGITVAADSPGVREARKDGRLVRIDPHDLNDVPEIGTLEESDLASLGVSERIVAVLTENGLTTVDAVAAWVRRGQKLTDLVGVGEGIEAQIMKALEEKELIVPRT